VIKNLLIALLCWTLVALIASAALAAPRTPTVAEVTRDIQRMYTAFANNDSALDAAITGIYGDLPADKQQLMKAFLRSMYLNERAWPIVAQAVQAYVAANTSSNLSVFQQGLGIVTHDVYFGFYDKGMRRLSDEQLAADLRYTIASAEIAPPELCKSQFLNQGRRESTQEMAKFNSLLPTKDYAALLNIYHAAMEAELNDSPPVRTLSLEQTAATGKAYALAVKNRSARLPSGVFERVKADRVGADPKEACMVALATLKAVLDLKEPYRSWQTFLSETAH
jgi:hypothetical protein